MVHYNCLYPQEWDIKFINKLQTYTLQTLSTFLYSKPNTPFAYLYSLFACFFPFLSKSYIKPHISKSPMCYPKPMVSNPSQTQKVIYQTTNSKILTLIKIKNKNHLSQVSIISTLTQILSTLHN